ncbi:MAG: dephospho-CoA kinase [Dehalococcoidia bacterium]|nr:dephospho-CoA kinase [Dehalococcoidia bacterium]MDH4299802.1 dephospho-CoA kinase [Dehalococcoidia bacterium]MDH4367036.1 dephospho-CoA kinase [Dehalococcoidia bacterium]
MVIVGLTGGVATGKSMVAAFFKELGAYMIDWDELAREVVRPRLKAWKEIVEYFGKTILNDDFTINRQKLANMVFSNKEKLAMLNQIVHPRVFREDERLTNEIRRLDPDAVIIKDIPLLFEVSRPIFVDKVVVVSASEHIQLRRLKEKGMSRQDAQNRIRSQLPLEKKVKSAHFVINNDGTPEETKRQVEEIYSLLRKGTKHGEQRVRRGPSRKIGRR